jgi:hypothetical protein
LPVGTIEPLSILTIAIPTATDILVYTVPAGKMLIVSNVTFPNVNAANYVKRAWVDYVWTPLVKTLYKAWDELHAMHTLGSDMWATLFWELYSI